jgi:hypothetical protein
MDWTGYADGYSSEYDDGDVNMEDCDEDEEIEWGYARHQFYWFFIMEELTPMWTRHHFRVEIAPELIKAAMSPTRIYLKMLMADFEYVMNNM